MFKRKATEKLQEWKEKYSHSYAAMLEGARRVGKSTIAEEFAKQAYRSYIKVDFANITRDLLSVFDDIANLNLFFLRLQAATHTTLFPGESVLIFDEIQRAPKVRQAIKYLVADGRYNYIETGSLISIKKNVKDIVIPSEEYKIPVYPMDYEEFLWATGSSRYESLRELYRMNQPVGNHLNTSLMREFRIYMAVGGMPQAVAAYVEEKSFQEIDVVKRGIINLYKEDFRKIDTSGRISMMFDAIPSQLALGRKHYFLSSAVNKRVTNKDLELFADLLDSKTVLICYNTKNPSVALAQTKDLSSYKLYLSDTGLFTTMLFQDESEANKEIYNKLLSNKLEANLGFLYENAAAQIITSFGRSLYYHTWEKENSTHSYEIDFLLSSRTKIVPVEVKSSSVKTHESIIAFAQKYRQIVSREVLLSQKDVGLKGNLQLKPIYMFPFLLEEL